MLQLLRIRNGLNHLSPTRMFTERLFTCLKAKRWNTSYNKIGTYIPNYIFLALYILYHFIVFLFT